MIIAVLSCLINGIAWPADQNGAAPLCQACQVHLHVIFIAKKG